MDFTFLGGSMGSVVGEKLTRLIERATESGLPLIIISTSGGAGVRSMFSLCRWPRPAPLWPTTRKLACRISVC